MKPLHNCRIKRYPDGSAEIVAASAPFGGGEIRREPPRFDTGEAEQAIFEAMLSDEYRAILAEERYAALERAAIQDEGEDPSVRKARQANRERAQRRARVAVRDLGLCNDWAYFVTLTLDRQRIDRYDPAEVVRHLNHWLDNRVRRDGLAYVLVPEHHKDGAIHFHGFFNDALPAVDSGHKDSGGHTVYNLPAWGWGFSTAIRLYGDRRAAVGYCCKYIAKEQDKIGGRWYYSGGKLRRPEVEWCDVDYEALTADSGAEPFTVDGLPWSRFVRLCADGGDAAAAALSKLEVLPDDRRGDLRGLPHGKGTDSQESCESSETAPGSSQESCEPQGAEIPLAEVGREKPSLQFQESQTPPPPPPGRALRAGGRGG